MSGLRDWINMVLAAIVAPLVMRLLFAAVVDPFAAFIGLGAVMRAYCEGALGFGLALWLVSEMEGDE